MQTPDKVTIIGSYLSPYVRKVLVVLELKKIPYEVDPLVPFYGNENFEKLNFLRTIPIMIDGDVVLIDSSVIIQYLDEKYPAVNATPHSIVLRAKHRIIEEYMDTFGAHVLIWGIWNQKVIRPSIFEQGVDKEKLDELKMKDFHIVCSHLETMLSEIQCNYPLASVGCFFRNTSLLGIGVDGNLYPLLKNTIDQCYKHKEFKSRFEFEMVSLSFHPLQHRKILKEIGAPITENSLIWNTSPRFGPLTAYNLQ